MLVPMSELLACDLPDTNVVAWHDSNSVELGTLRQTVRRLSQDLQATETQSVVLAAEDGISVAVGILAGFYAGCRIDFPANLQTATLRKMSGPGSRILRSDDIELCHQILSDDGDEKFAILDPVECRLVFHTSGSAGAPKRIEKNLRQLECEITGLERLWGRPGDQGVIFSMVAPYHIYGLLFTVLWPLSSGQIFTSATVGSSEQLLCLPCQEGTVIASPAHLSRLPKIARATAADKNLRIFSSGAPLSLDAAEDCRRTFGRLPIEGYGSTETGGIAFRRQETESQPWKKVDDVDISVSEEGLLRLRSPYLPSNGWYTTDDMVELIGKDQFHLLRRTDRIVKIAGKRVNLVEMEQQLAGLPDINDVAVTALPGQRDRLGAVVILTQDGFAKLAEMGAFRLNRIFRRELAYNFDLVAVPDYWRFVEQIPVNSQGKRLYEAIVDLFSEHG